MTGKTDAFEVNENIDTFVKFDKTEDILSNLQMIYLYVLNYSCRKGIFSAHTQSFMCSLGKVNYSYLQDF